MTASKRIVSEIQEAKKIATLWAYCHGAPVASCVQTAERWIRTPRPVDERTWEKLEAHLRTQLLSR